MSEDRQSPQGCTHHITSVLGFVPFCSSVRSPRSVPRGDCGREGVLLPGASPPSALTLGSQPLIILHRYPPLCCPGEVPSRAQRCSLCPLRCGFLRCSLHCHPRSRINHGSDIASLQRFLPSLLALHQAPCSPFITTTGFITHFIR